MRSPSGRSRRSDLRRRLVPGILRLVVTGALVAAAVAIPSASAVSAEDTISTVAGTGISGFSGDGGKATAAKLRFPLGVAVDAAGNLLIADTGSNRIRRVNTKGVISTMAGTGAFGFSGDGGPAASAVLDNPQDVATDGAGNVYVVDTFNRRVRKVDAGGAISTIAGTGGIGYNGDGRPATSATLNDPLGLAVDPAGVVYIADSFNNRVRRVGPDGMITTVAGTGGAGYNGDGRTATSALLSLPAGVTVDSAGNLYIADQLNHRVRKVSPSGVISTVAGNGTPGYAGDGGPATAARLNSPRDVAVDAAGSLYIADTFNHRVRKVAPDGQITTVAGTGKPDFAGDGLRARAADLNSPSGVAVGASGTLYIADRSNHRIRAVTGPAPAPRPKCKGKPATIVGTNGPDVIKGTSAADVIVAKGGNDVVKAGRGHDLVCLGPGQDRGFGGAGNDRIYGQAGGDRIQGDGGRDQLYGGSGPDRLIGKAGRDSLVGGSGRDTGDGGTGVDVCRTEKRLRCP